MNVFCHLMFEQIHKNNHSEGVGDIMKQDHGCYCNKPVKSSTDIELVNLQCEYHLHVKNRTITVQWNLQ